MKPRFVTFNGMELELQYNPEDWVFYSDESNNEKSIEQLEQHNIEAEDLKKEWKTEKEIREYFVNKWTVFIDRVKYIVITPDDNIIELVNDLISKMS